MPFLPATYKEHYAEVQLALFLVLCLSQAFGVTNPGFEDGSESWENLEIGSHEYFAPVDGLSYAKVSAGPEYVHQTTDLTIEAGKTYTLKLWTRSLLSDEYIADLLSPSGDWPSGTSERAVAEVQLFSELGTLASTLLDVQPKPLSGAPSTTPADDGCNVWIDGDYRVALVGEFSFYQLVTDDPIASPWSVVQHTNGPEGLAVGQIITTQGLKALYVTDYEEPDFSEIWISRASGNPPDYSWSDPEVIIANYTDEDPWVLDAHLFQSDTDGRLFLSWGGQPFRVTELNPETGLILGNPESPLYDSHPSGTHIPVANWSGDEWTDGNDWFEGPALFQRGAYWYLFGSYGNLSLNYTIRMGRGTSPEGPFFDKQGRNMNVFDETDNEYGNSFLLGDDGDQVVPGHPHIWEESGDFYMGYDYRRRKSVEDVELDFNGIRRLYFENGWPTIWTPVEITFNADDFPAAIGQQLGIRFRNNGDANSFLGVDRVGISVEDNSPNFDQNITSWILFGSSNIRPLGNVWCIGDSWTDCWRGTTWRRSLWQNLSVNGKTVEFVGANSDDMACELGQVYDRDHDGYGGLTAQELLLEIDGVLESLNPDTLLLMIGGNDIENTPDFSLIMQRISGIVAKVRSKNPNVFIHLGTYGYVDINVSDAQADEFADLIQELSISLNTSESPVVFVDHRVGWDKATDLDTDLFHPSPAGMEKIAANWLASILAHQVGQTIVYPAEGSARERLAAHEVRRYVYLRTAKKLPLLAMETLPTGGNVILVADSDDTMVRQLSNEINHETTPGGFILKTVAENSRRVLVITGHDSTATLQGAYRFAEHLGVSFDLAGDALPDARINLDIAGFDEVGIPRFQTRGILPFHDFFAGPDVWNTEDYKAIIAQLPKLGMNFIGFHSYNTRYTSQWARENDVRSGPEPTVWIGLPQDVNPDGTVSWSYPSHYAHTHRQNAWGFDVWDTDYFHAGASLLFPTSGYGSDVLGASLPVDEEACNTVFNRVGDMFDEAFSLGRHLGVKTAVGTELPLGLEPAGVGHIDPPEDWVRGMPAELQNRLARLGKDPSDPNVVKEIYKGIFARIMRTHPLDYYWLWSYEIWSDAPGVTNEQIEAIENDISIAQQALAELGNPFQIAHAGWKTGTVDNPAELEDVFPPEAPFYSQWGDAEGHDSLSPERVKWPGVHLEQDWGLVQPQGGVYAAHEDISKAFEYECNGSIGNLWRTRVLSPNLFAVKNLHWAYGPTGQPVALDLPVDMWLWAESIYHDWATRQFGQDTGPVVGTILSEIDGDYPTPSGWEEDGPGEILSNPNPWTKEQRQYNFVEELATLRPRITGAGNRERFDYWLKNMQSLRLMGEYGCIRYDFERAIRRGDYPLALQHRIEMARLFERLMTLHVEKVTNASDLGEIIHLELVNWKQLMINRWDDILTAGLGKSLPAEANPSQDYLGEPFIKVTPARSHIEAGEELELTLLAPGVKGPMTLNYRTLGKGDYHVLPLTHVSRAVYKAAIPPQRDDFEYYIEAKTAEAPIRFPASATELNQTVILLKK